MKGHMNYLVTGATGNIGAHVVERLIECGDRPRIFVRDAEKARALYRDRVDIFVGDLADVTTLTPALVNVDAFFLVTSGHNLATLDGMAARAAKAAGVKRLVKLSSFDAREQNVGTGVWHAQGESAVRASGVVFTFVQPTGFMDNARYWARSIKIDGAVRSATGDGRIPFIHSTDIADVAVQALTRPEYDGQSLPITGPVALSYAEMASQISAVIGKPIRFQSISDEEARQQQSAWGTSEELTEARLSIFRAIREGRLAAVTGTVERTLGRKPISFDQWAQENAAMFL